jgi:hypothetical protein
LTADRVAGSKHLSAEDPPPSRRDTSAELNSLTDHVAKSRQHFVDESPPWSRVVVSRSHLATSHPAVQAARSNVTMATVSQIDRHRLIDTAEATDKPRSSLAATVKERSHEQ